MNPDATSAAAGGDENEPYGIIDFRFRPIGARSWTPSTTYHYLDRMGLGPCPSFVEQSRELMFAEMDEAGISLGVIGVPGPTGIRGLDPTGSAEIKQIVDEYPDRFVGFGSVEPSDVDAAVTAVGELAALGVAYKQPNVVIVPGQYVHYGFPGSDDYVTALARQLPDQILFGSVYPNCGPLTDLRRIVASWDLPPRIERKYLRDNAARVLGL